VISGSVFYRQVQGLKFYTKIKLDRQNEGGNVEKGEHFEKYLCMCARASAFKCTLKVRFLQDLSVSM